MSTYANDLRVKEITTGDEDGTWGVSLNTSLSLIGEALSYATQEVFSSDADATTTVADGASDPARAMFFRVTSAGALTVTRTMTIAPNTISRVMYIQNATTGGQSITVSQGSGGSVTIPSGMTKAVYLDGAGAGAAVVDAFANFSFAAGAFTTLSASGQITSTVTTGTAPFVVASTTNVANLNASLLAGGTWASPGAIGSTTPAAGTFTALTATGAFTSLGIDDNATGNTLLLTGNGDATGAAVLYGTLSVGFTTESDRDPRLSIANSVADFEAIRVATSAGVHGSVGVASGGGFYIVSGAAAAMRVGQVGAQDLYLISSNQNRVTVKSTGNVGIATTTPQARLDLGVGASTYTSGQERLLIPTAGSTYYPSIGTSNRTYIHTIGDGGGSEFGVGIHGYQVGNPLSANWMRVAQGLTNNTVAYYRADSSGFRIYADANKTTGDADYTPTLRFDFRASGTAYFYGNVQLQDNGVLHLGNAQDLSLWRDGSNSYIRDSGTGSLFIEGSGIYFRSGDGLEYLASFVADGAATLYYDNSVKLATTTSGVAVTGALTTTGNITATTTAAGVGLTTFWNNASPVDGDLIFQHVMRSTDSGAGTFDYVTINAYAEETNAAISRGKYTITVANEGAIGPLEFSLSGQDGFEVSHFASTLSFTSGGGLQLTGAFGFNGGSLAGPAALVANATDLASAITLVNALKTIMVNIGFMSAT